MRTQRERMPEGCHFMRPASRVSGRAFREVGRSPFLGLNTGRVCYHSPQYAFWSVTLADLSSQPTPVQTIYNWYRDGALYVNRKYQRKLVWTLIEKQKLIDSILRGYPI